MLATYATLVAMLVGYGVAAGFIGDLENERLASLVDPFAISAFTINTKFWTVYEKNSQVVELAGPFLANRLLWLGIAGTVLAVTLARFRMQLGVASGKEGRRRALALAAEAQPPALGGPLPSPAQSFDAAGSFRQYLHATRVELAGTLKSLPFLVIFALGVLNVIGGSKPVDHLYGTPVFPVTHLMVRVISGSFMLFALIIGTFYAGELIWKERTAKVNEVFDALPTPSWVFWSSKLSALALIILVLLTGAMLTTLGVQLYWGYHRFELGLYAKSLFLLEGGEFLQMMVLAFFVQVLTSNKYLGFLVMVLFFASTLALPGLKYEHHLYLYASAPPSPYSDMNGYGHFVQPRAWFGLYWSLLAAALVVGVHLLWVRGAETRLRWRWKLARARTGRGAWAALGLSLAGFAGVGAYIFYNTNVVNPYRTTEDDDRRLAEVERRYKQYERLPQPRITDVRADVEIFPAERGARIRGEYRLANKTPQTITDLHVSMNPDVPRFEVNLPGAQSLLDDREHGYRIYRLATPLAPGETMALPFTIAVEHRGFVNGASDNHFVHNGTFFNSMEYFPHLGYPRAGELEDANKRRKYGLPPVVRMAKADDPAARMNNEISSDADWINLDTTVSTSEDQVALAPGYLQREWRENGRRYFHYKTEAPILSFWSYLSARYEVKRDAWKDIPIEVYYHPDHPYNVDRMIDAVKKSLAYFTENFSPYQHRQVRILEFPATSASRSPSRTPSRGRSRSASSPRSRTRTRFDYVFFITAHEIAHQWWAHQVVGARVQGATMITETLAEYSALMVMEREYGKDKMKRFLAYELNRYLRGRGGELVAELPLEQVEGQSYIHYAKGSMVMYALRDYIGEDTVNRVLAQLIKDQAYQGPPYTTAADLVDRFRAAVPEDQRSLIEDLFETITLYDSRAVEATATPVGDGEYRVRWVVEVKKLRSDDRGSEREIPVNDLMDVAVLGEKGEPLFMEKRRITGPRMTFEATVRQRPAKAGVDPYNKLIDRNPEDNTTRVTVGAAGAQASR